MSRNHKIHIIIASIGMFISFLLAITGMFIRPSQTIADPYVLYTTIGFIGIALFIIFTIYLMVSLYSKEKHHSIRKNTLKYILYTVLLIGALSLLILGVSIISTSYDSVPLSTFLIILGLIILAVDIDLFVESIPESNKFVTRLSVCIATLFAIAIVTSFLCVFPQILLTF